MKIGARKYQGFLIDADNTIFDYDHCEKEAFAETMQAINYSGSLETAHRKFHVINRSVWRNFEENKIAANAINRQRFTVLLKSLKMDADLDKTAALYLENLSHKTYTLPHAVRTLEYLSCRAALCLITNGLAYVQRSRIARAGIEIFFNGIIISEEIGCSKPGAEIFKAALDTLKLAPYNVLCIGDSPSSDIRGGHQHGLDTCWFMSRQMDYPPEEPLPDYIISDLRELRRFTCRLS